MGLIWRELSFSSAARSVYRTSWLKDDERVAKEALILRIHITWLKRVSTDILRIYPWWPWWQPWWWWWWRWWCWFPFLWLMFLSAESSAWLSVTTVFTILRVNSSYSEWISTEIISMKTSVRCDVMKSNRWNENQWELTRIWSFQHQSNITYVKRQ